MEQYRVGQNVQAIDELGRCAEGKVADITENGVEITFCGWGQENNVVLKPGCGGISAPIHAVQFAVGVPAKNMEKKKPKITKAVERDSVLLTSTHHCASATSTSVVSRAALGLNLIHL